MSSARIKTLFGFWVAWAYTLASPESASISPQATSTADTTEARSGRVLVTETALLATAACPAERRCRPRLAGWCTGPLPLSGQRRHQLAVEVGDVGDDAPPDEVAVRKSGLVRPGGPGVDEVVLDAERARGAGPFDDASGDGD